MEKTEAERSGPEEGSQLNRNRSFKSKQLVRSQAIRETHSPPRTASPPPPPPDDVTSDAKDADDRRDANSTSDCNETVKQRVEIQITPGAWDEPHEQRQRTKRWLGHRQPRDLLSNGPRVACVCAPHASCDCRCVQQHRGRRRKHMCPTKQDSGIVCSDDCPDCSDTEPSGGSNADGTRKTNSLDDGEFYCRCPERKEKPKNISLSRTDSDEKSEPTGPELVAFIKETLNKNPRDRMTLLKIEKELHALVNDVGRCIVRFPVMTSYGRMLVHRCAALFQLSHHLDHTNKNSVLVSKSGTSGGRIPCTNFKQWCTAVFPPSPQRSPPDSTSAKSILKRDTQSLDEASAGPMSAARSKSLEQREREYERVRRRIFSSDNCTQDETQWQWLNTGPVKLLTPEAGRNKLLKVQSLEGAASQPPARGPVSKSHSFGGYGRAGEPPRVLSRQGDLASSSWRLSPSSSGYRTLSLHSTDSVTPSPTGGASPEPALGPADGAAVVWAVTDLSAVPPGAIVIHPQTGRPLTNPDGSVYHFDPLTPPVLPGPYVHNGQTKTENSEKKRGRLEKQHSFIDNDCECQPSEECRSKCCCDCRRHESCNKSNPDKTTTPQEQKVTQKPPSPCKPRYDQIIDAANQNTPQEPTNHRPTYDLATNQMPAPENPTNQHAVYDVANQNYNASPNLRPGFEMPRYEPNRQFENRPPSYEANQTFDLTNQRLANDMANQRAVKLANQGSSEVQYISQQFPQGYAHEQVPLPQPGATYITPDMQQLKQMPMQDQNLRQLPYGMVYSGMQYPYQLLDKGCVSACVSPGPPHAHDAGVAREANFQYAGAEYPCVSCEPPARPYLYTHVEPVQYPQHHAYPYQEQLAWQGVQPMLPAASAAPKLFVPELYPMLYPALYPQYNVVYPQQVMQQPYSVVAPIYQPQEARVDQRRNSNAGSQRLSKRNSYSGSSRNTPLAQPDDKAVPYDDQSQNPHMQIPTVATSPANHMQQNPQNPNTQSARALNRQDSNEIAAKIQMIKDQMAQLNTRDRDRDREKNPRREEWRRRNSGNGILGSYPVNNFNGRVMQRPPNDENQLSTAARAIVNSIRCIQVKNNYQDRRDFTNQSNTYHSPHSSQPRAPPRAAWRPRPGERPAPDERPLPLPYRPSYLLRQMSPGTWCRRSPGPVHPVMNHPRRPHPDNRNNRR